MLVVNACGDGNIFINLLKVEVIYWHSLLRARTIKSYTAYSTDVYGSRYYLAYQEMLYVTGH